MVRQIFDIFVYFSQHTILAFMVFLGLWLAGTRVLGLDRRLSNLTSRLGSKAIVVASLSLFLVYLLISGWYLTINGFAGEVEPTVTSLAWMVQDGHPLYHALHSPARYSVLYGPSVFLTNGLFLKILGPSLFSTKMASALAGLGSLLLLYGAVARKGRDVVAVSMVGLAVLYYWCQGFAVYLVRPDSLLLFSVSFGLYCAVRVRRIFAILAVGAVLGFAINLKIHAGFYFLPILAILYRRFGWWSLLHTAVVGCAGALAPFVFYSQISLVNYIVWLKNAMGHGLGLATVPITGRYTFGLVVPMAALLLLNQSAKKWLQSQLLLVLAMIGSIFGILVLSAKPGAGLVHLLPLVPTSLFIISLLLRDLPLDTWTRPCRGTVCGHLGKGAAVAMVMTVMMAGLVHEYRICRLVHWENLEARALVGDIEDIQATYPGLAISMAVGGEDENYRYAWMRPLLVFNHHPLLLDPIAVMDCHLSGQEMPPEMYAALSRGQVAVWLVPKEERPFAKANWYPPHEPIFSEAFMDHFQANYTPRSQSRFFDLWIWNGLSGDALGEPAIAAVKVVGWSS